MQPRMGGIIQANIPDKATLYASYMPFVVGGGLFIPSKQPVKMGEEVFVLVTLPEQAQQFLNQHLPHTDLAQQHLLMNLSNHMPLQAITLSESEWIPQRAEFVKDWQKLVIDKNMPMAIATKWNKALAFSDFSQMFEYLLSDLICVKLNQQLKNTDLDFSMLAERYSLETLFLIYAELQQSKKYIEQNVQTNLVLDQLCIRLMDV